MRKSILFLIFFFFTSCGQSMFNDDTLSFEQKTTMVNTIYQLIEDNWVFSTDMDQLKIDLDSTLTNVNQQDFLLNIDNVLADLNDGHLNLMWIPEGKEHYYPYANIDYYNSKIMVMATGATSLLQPGDIIIAVNGTNSISMWSNYLEISYGSTLRNKQRGATEKLFFGPENINFQLTVIRSGLTNNITIPYQERSGYPLENLMLTNRFGNIGYIRIRTMGYIDMMDQVDIAINNMMDCEGLIIDLRRNGGGFSANSDYIVGRFVDTEPESFKMLYKGGKLKREIGPFPRGKQYTGKIVVLTDCYTFSAANHFAEMIKFYNLGTIIGEKSGGGVGSPEVKEKFTENISFRVSSLLVVTPDNTHFEKGVPVDIEVTFTDAEISAGLNSDWGNPSLDKTLQTAIDYLEGLE